MIKYIMPKSVKKSVKKSKSHSKSRNRRGNYPQNGAQPVVTHPYKLWVNDNTYPEAAVELKQIPMEANATHIPSWGIDINTLKRKGTMIPLDKGWPIGLKDGSTVYILFEHSSYALPYIYESQFGYSRDPQMDDMLNNKAEQDNPLTWYSRNRNFSKIQVYSMEYLPRNVYLPRNSKRYNI
jgi:hypothetical protein